MNHSFLQFAAVLIHGILFGASKAGAAVVTGTKKTLQQGQLQYHYDNSSDAPCQTVVIINVGTFMSVTDYKKLGSALAIKGSEEGVVAIIMDSNPGVITKQSGPKFTKLGNAIYQQIGDLVPACKDASAPQFVIGGHSGGGEGAVRAMVDGMLTFDVAGYVGLAPYKISESKYDIQVPALLWGLSTMSCGVNPEDAAIAAYNIAPLTNRVFYQVQTFNWNKLLGGPHCSFTDKGCGVPGIRLCSGDPEYDYMPDAVGQSLAKFVNAIALQNFSKAGFELDLDGIDLFVNQDEVTVNGALVGSSLGSTPAFEAEL
jgi:hypothetical protein